MSVDHSDSEMMRYAVAEAVQEALPKAMPIGLKASLKDPEVWAAASEGMQQHVSNKAGGWIMKTVLMFFSRLMLFLVLGSIVYALGGWPLLAKIFAGGSK